MHRIFVLFIGLTLLFFGSVPVSAQVPNQAISRFDAIKVLVEQDPDLFERVFYHAEHLPPLPLFRDTAQVLPHAPYIEAAFEAGILPGIADRMLYPSAPLYSESALALLLRAKGDRTPLTEQWFHIRPQTDRTTLNQLAHYALQKGIVIPQGLRAGQALSWQEFSIMLQNDSSFLPAQTQLFMPQSPLPASLPSGPLPLPPPPPPPPPPHPFLSRKDFAITMPTLDIYDLGIAHPEDPLTQQGLLEPLQAGVGHLFSYPGRGGNILVYGHSSGYPWDVSQFTRIFRKVNRLQKGDAIYVTYNGAVHEYQVTGQETIPTRDISRLQSTHGEELILYTCWPPDSTSQRYIVRARKSV
ncbi:hypothetical protein COU77_00895 [Candidatus Peregrinibacteria bacterium CG10_big_fil_rev_8_21_14_0_10_49_16]|nr:MAG: hypothetical protein COW95_03665 [Candidatus Peregrinibacteria bacterium CG22_combo_CG10-13_8_21_14_all_49_11]PIR52342.1 MAG: hypothetical protein COU77_00895 [Candidatus Peregrinibacteria bacterium CG10_big_fil_rev_8_21_14_0_10_49_16]